MLFFLTHSHQQLEQLTKGNAVMEKAMTVLDYLSQDTQMRLLYEAHPRL